MCNNFPKMKKYFWQLRQWTGGTQISLRNIEIYWKHEYTYNHVDIDKQYSRNNVKCLPILKDSICSLQALM